MQVGQTHEEIQAECRARREAAKVEWERHLARTRDASAGLDENGVADRIAAITAPLWGVGWGALRLRRQPSDSYRGDEADGWRAEIEGRGGAGYGPTPRLALVELLAHVIRCASDKSDATRRGLSGEKPPEEA